MNFNPQIHIPLQAQGLLLPLDEGAYEEWPRRIAGAELLALDYKNSKLSIRLRYGDTFLFPKWEEWEDGQGATMNVLDSDGKVIPLSRNEMNAGRLYEISRSSTDGFNIHMGKTAILACGKLDYMNELSVYWVLSSHPLSPDFMPNEETDWYMFPIPTGL
jgi:hypothetical protein